MKRSHTSKEKRRFQKAYRKLIKPIKYRRRTAKEIELARKARKDERTW